MPTKRAQRKDLAKDINLMFSDRRKVGFTYKDGVTKVEEGRWCLTCQ